MMSSISGLRANLDAMKVLVDIMIDRSTHLGDDDLLVARIEARLLRVALQNWVEESSAAPWSKRSPKCGAISGINPTADRLLASMCKVEAEAEDAGD